MTKWQFKQDQITLFLYYCIVNFFFMIIMQPVSWIIETLYAGELAPFKRDGYHLFRRIKVSKLNAGEEAFDMSQEI